MYGCSLITKPNHNHFNRSVRLIFNVGMLDLFGTMEQG